VSSTLKDILSPILMAGRSVLPVVEGGKGIGVSNGTTAGYFAKAGAIGTFSGVNARLVNENGEYEPLIYKGKTRIEKHFELVEYSIRSAISQAKRAFDISSGKGLVHMNVLWEMGGAQRVLNGVLDKTKGLINGITCGAGMPYKLAEIAGKYKVHYYPIVSSMRAFNILWKRSYKNFSEWLGGVVYECPWRAGGHNGLSNAEDPEIPGSTYARVAEIRKFMDSVGLNDTPIIIAGGVWHVKDYEHFLDNPEIGKVAFQFGTRPIYTQESPVSEAWKKRLFTLDEGDVYLNRFSPTGFYSSAVNNAFIQELRERNERQISFKEGVQEGFTKDLAYGNRGRVVFVRETDFIKAQNWHTQGFTETIKTPDHTVIFIKPSKKTEILLDQRDCMGCLSACKFSNWMENKEAEDEDSEGDWSTGNLPDPRSFCIQKTLQQSIETDEIENSLMFAGNQAFNFKTDAWYQDGKFVPTIAQLVQRILTGY
jgi:NAD(P)H-dependent flavin oxidoreductase YrpB (nitropropane dioxygenase family)